MKKLTFTLLAAALLAPLIPAARGQMTAARGQITAPMPAVQYWDPGLTGFTPGSGGNGTWNGTTANWYNSAAPGDRVYSPSTITYFAGTAGTVTLGESLSNSNTIFFTVAGYTVQDAAGTSYSLSLSSALYHGVSSGTTTLNVPLTLGSTTLAAVGGGTLAIPGAITTNGSLAVGNSSYVGTVSLSGTNAISNPITVNGGMLAVASNGALGTANVSLSGATQLTLNAGVLITNQNATTLTLISATTSKVNLLGSGVQDTVNALVIGGVAQPPGTYGAVGNTLATNPSADFTGTGLLTVLSGPAVAPEPSTWAALLCGTGVLVLTNLHRQRRRD